MNARHFHALTRSQDTLIRLSAPKLKDERITPRLVVPLRAVPATATLAEIVRYRN